MDDVILEVRHLSHRFKLTRKLAVQALDDLSFQVRRGEIFGLVGESGSGKSTVARCVMNLYQPTSGEIWFNGVNITDREPAAQAQKNAGKETAAHLSGLRLQHEPADEGGGRDHRAYAHPAHPDAPEDAPRGGRPSS